MRVARKFGSPTLSRLRVWRDLEIQNRVTKYWTRTRTGGGDECGGTRTGVMAADMWWRIWIRIGGEYVVVVYGNSNDDDAVVIYGSGDVTTCEHN